MNINKHKLVLPICIFAVFVLWMSGSAGATFISNLSERCYRCLCYVATTCHMTHGCTGGYCGPFNISKVYWIDSGRIVLSEDDPNRNSAWKDCARNYQCAKNIIEGYLKKYGKDCNGDGVTDCFDYMMINYNGGFSCSDSLKDSESGRLALQRYSECHIKYIHEL